MLCEVDTTTQPIRLHAVSCEEFEIERLKEAVEKNEYISASVFPDNTEAPPQQPKTFRQQLSDLVNYNSKENGSDTPDFILAQYLEGCLEVFDKTVRRREEWYGRSEPEGFATLIDNAD